VGCASCGGSGHAGRVGIFEMAEVTPQITAAIDRGATEAELKDLALRAGETLIGQGLLAVALGEVSLPEALRVVGDVA
jgi:general secretion pathway protein E